MALAGKDPLLRNENTNKIFKKKGLLYNIVSKLMEGNKGNTENVTCHAEKCVQGLCVHECLDCATI